MDCAGSTAVIGWIPRLLLRTVIRTQTQRSAAWFGGKDEDPRPAGKGNGFHFTELSPSAQLFVCHCLPPDRTWHKVNDQKVVYSGGWGRGRSDSSRNSNATRLGWSSSPTRRWPSRNWKPFGLESIHYFEHRAEQKPGWLVDFWLLSVFLYSFNHCHFAGWGKYFSTQEVPL